MSSWFRSRSLSIHRADYSFRIKFVPQYDITTFELAQILARLKGTNWDLQNIPVTREYWDSMPPSILRHFQRL